MVGWCYRLNGLEFEHALVDGEGQGSLVCCSPWGCKESDMTEWLNNNHNNNWISWCVSFHSLWCMRFICIIVCGCSSHLYSKDDSIIYILLLIICSALDGCLELLQFLALLKNAVNICKFQKRPLWTKSSEKPAQLNVATSRRRRSWSIMWSLIMFISVGQCSLAFWEKQSHEERDGVRECLRNWKQCFPPEQGLAGRVDCGVGVERRGRVSIVPLSHTLPAQCWLPWGSLGQEWFWDRTSECLGLCSGQRYIRNFVETQSLQLKRASAGIVCSPV